LLAPYVNLAILLVATFAAVVYVKKRRQVRDKNKKTHVNNLLSTILIFTFCFDYLMTQRLHQKPQLPKELLFR
jgi:hypothetical protein